ncbi:MAG: orotate phosphoribosyltransferase [Gaiellales bacterium]|nr:orotate phosphoribosyltransferase [Gaiellales bacterium]
MTRSELAARVAERALLHGDFVLRSGKRSTVYLDKYRFETDPALLGPIGEELGELIAAADPRPARLAGPELGAVPLAAAASLACGVPFLIVRKDAKEYGTAERIEGVFEPGERVLVIEDVVTTGGALISAIEALRAADLVVEAALCVLDREEGGNEALAALGVHLEPIFRRADLGMPVS